ncbi:MAG: FGGY-family carbohydrate kinase [Piscirickettsiaceae bacterium]|nr:FGGY-family carbohydrate kinase [Piscirickettsiaceae bacterium]
MIANDAYIGIDLGTSGCRAIAINKFGDIIAQNENIISAYQQKDYHSEQSPELQWRLVEMVLSMLFTKIEKYQVKRIAVDSTSSSILLIDKSGEPLTPLLMYNDSRAKTESEFIKQNIPAKSGAHGASSGLSKLLYLQEKYDLDIESGVTLLHQADWINHNLGVDTSVTDYNNALKLGYDSILKCWPDWLLTMVPEQVLPTVVQPGTIIGRLSKSLCQKFDIEYFPTIVSGTTDSIAAILATRINNVGDAVTSIGSTLVLKLIAKYPVFKHEHGIYSHRIGKLWLVGGASNSGGAILRHFFTKRQLIDLSTQIVLNRMPPDYYPLLSSGERFPELNPYLKPRLTPRPKDDHEFLYGLLTGIAKIEAEGYRLLQKYSLTDIKYIYTVGDGSNNRIWEIIRQQLLNVSFSHPQYKKAAYGAAILARDQLQYNQLIS